MRDVVFIVTTSDKNTRRNLSLWRDFCYNNNLEIGIGQIEKKAINPLTGDKYLFYNLLTIEDTYMLAGLIVHSYIHLDPLPCLGVLDGGEKDNQFRYYLLSRLRRLQEIRIKEVIREVIKEVEVVRKPLPLSDRIIKGITNFLRRP